MASDFIRNIVRWRASDEIGNQSYKAVPKWFEMCCRESEGPIVVMTRETT